MVDVEPETIEVRTDETFDVDALAHWIGDRLDGAAGVPRVRQFSRGKANLTYLLEFRNGAEFVLRRPPLGPVAPRSHDMAREFRVLSVLWRAFPKAPRAHLFCDDSSIIGAPFLIMERRHGVVVQNHVPEIFGAGSDPTANRKLSEVVIDTLAEFHSVDPTTAGLAHLGHPEGFLTRQVEGWTQRWDAAKHEDNPLADDVARWLADNMPRSPAATLVHNDWRLDNMAVDPADPGRCVAVYDWDMCTTGDPLADLGTVLAVWYDPDEAPAALNPMPTRSQGFMSRSEAMQRYVDHATGASDSLDWYVVFGTFKLAAVLQQIFIRWHRGQTEDERFRDYGLAARRLVELADQRRPF